MSILSNNLLNDHVYPKLIEKLKKILNPLNQNPTIGNYTDLIQSIDEITRETALQLIKGFLETLMHFKYIKCELFILLETISHWRVAYYHFTYLELTQFVL